jgi:hypothetical protein
MLYAGAFFALFWWFASLTRPCNELYWCLDLFCLLPLHVQCFCSPSFLIALQLHFKDAFLPLHVQCFCSPSFLIALQLHFKDALLAPMICSALVVLWPCCTRRPAMFRRLNTVYWVKLTTSSRPSVLCQLATACSCAWPCDHIAVAGTRSLPLLPIGWGRLQPPPCPVVVFAGHVEAALSSSSVSVCLPLRNYVLQV